MLQVPQLLLHDQAVLHALQLVLDHCAHLLVQECALLLIQVALLLIARLQCFFGQLEVVLDDLERILQLGFKDLHFFFDKDEVFVIGVVVVSDLFQALVDVFLNYCMFTMRLLMGFSLMSIFSYLF